MYEEDEFLQLSGIQHFSFCRRQWALAYIELQWNENVRTVEGHLLHERAHDRTIAEKREISLFPGQCRSIPGVGNQRGV